jgi:hypothetical protein
MKRKAGWHPALRLRGSGGSLEANRRCIAHLRFLIAANIMAG